MSKEQLPSIASAVGSPTQLPFFPEGRFIISPSYHLSDFFESSTIVLHRSNASDLSVYLEETSNWFALSSRQSVKITFSRLANIRLQSKPTEAVGHLLVKCTSKTPFAICLPFPTFRLGRLAPPPYSMCVTLNTDPLDTYAGSVR